jgi:hypothetical protein
MAGRNLDANFAAAMQAAHVDGFVLVEMALDGGTLYMSGLPFAFDWAGHTYLPVMGVGTVHEILETDSEVADLNFTLSGVPESSIALALSEKVQGRAVIVRQACLDAGTIYMDENCWQGYLDVMAVDDTGPTAVINVTAVHAMAAYAEPKVVLFSNEDQQAISPGDRFFEYAAQMANATIVWPSKEFFKQ